MFILIRPIAAVVLGVFAFFAAQAYEPLFAPNAHLGRMPLVTAIVGAVVGYMFLGGRIKRALWFSVLMTWQAIILTAICTAFVLAIREIFVLGYRRRYDEVIEAFADIFAIMQNWLLRGVVPDYLIFLGIGGLVIGVILHVTWFLLERRRLAR